MSKQKFMALCMAQDLEWLKESARNPSKFWRPIHHALVLIAIRRKQGRK